MEEVSKRACRSPGGTNPLALSLVGAAHAGDSHQGASDAYQGCLGHYQCTLAYETDSGTMPDAYLRGAWAGVASLHQKLGMALV